MRVDGEAVGSALCGAQESLPGRAAQRRRVNMATTDLGHEIKEMILNVLHIPDVRAEDIDESSPIFENPLLGLDSVDALEIVVGLHRNYGVRIDDQNLARNVLQTIDTIAEFVEANQADSEQAGS